ncbi:MAG TPA: rhombosortase [Candidatus Tectomicrobia bacterium]|jgi:rhomboid family GlyGly-CTERM serine protease
MTQQRYWFWPVTLATLSVGAELAAWTPALRFERGMLLTEPWRVLTAHLVHLGWAHLLLNMAALFVLSALFAQDIRPMQWVRGWCVSSVAVSGGLYCWHPNLAVYVGSSGVLHGLAAAAVVPLCRRGSRYAVWLIGGLVLKLGWEQCVNSMPGVSAWVGGPVIVNAHLYGTLGGLACGLLEYGQELLQGPAHMPP